MKIRCVALISAGVAALIALTILTMDDVSNLLAILAWVLVCLSTFNLGCYCALWIHRD